MKPIWMKDAKKYYDKAPKQLQNRIDEAIQELIEFFPNVMKSNNVKSLQGYTGFYRYRVGGYRITFTIQNNMIYITGIGSRGDIYKK